MKSLAIAFLLLCGFSNYTYAQSGWFYQETGTDITLRSVLMINDNTGYAAGGDILIDEPDALDRGVILKTTNGGMNWFAQTDINFSKILYSIFFVNDQTGYTVGRDGSEFAILKTTNGGSEWVQQKPPTTTQTPPLHSIYFFNSETGFVTGAGGMVFRTTNGGTNWEISTFPNNLTLYSIIFTSSNTGYIGADNLIFKTTDTGASWDTSFSMPGIIFQSVFFTDIDNGYAGGSNRIFKTTNGGDSWSSQIFQGSDFTSVYFPSANTGYSVSSNTEIYKTTNAGSNWTMQVPPTASPLYSVYFTNDSTGFTVGNVGFMLRTLTGGTVGISLISGEVPETYKLSQNYPNPFNPETVIEYDITNRAHVNLSIYDVAGKIITQAIVGIQSAGVYRYHFDGNGLPGGVYFYKLTAGDFTAVRKMVLLK